MSSRRSSSVPPRRRLSPVLLSGLAVLLAAACGAARAAPPGCDLGGTDMPPDGIEFVQRVRTTDWLAVALVKTAGEPDACRLRAGQQLSEPLQLDFRWRSGIRFTLRCENGTCQALAHAPDGLPAAGQLRQALRYATIRVTGQDALQLQAWRDGAQQIMEWRAEELPLTAGRLVYTDGLLVSVTSQGTR